MLYAGVRARPRDPIARARLGRYLAMKGALRPGSCSWRKRESSAAVDHGARARDADPQLLDWRERVASSARDSTIFVRPPAGAGALMRLPLERGARR
jgi:hypothetical protein